MEQKQKELEQSVSGEETVVNDRGIDYISAINEMKQNSVSREQYEKLKNENKELLDTLINGGQVVSEQQETKSIDEMRKELFGKESVEKGMTNLEFVQKSLELRDAVIKSGGLDPFLPVGKGVEITREDVEAAEFTAQQYRECIDIANGNSEVFTNELMRRCVDNSRPTVNKKYYRR